MLNPFGEGHWYPFGEGLRGYVSNDPTEDIGMPNSFEGMEVYVGRLRVCGLVGRGIFSMPTVKLLI